MLILKIIFWIAIFFVFYTYIGYGIILVLMVKIKELFKKPKHLELKEYPDVTFFITAFNEEYIVDQKMKNCHELKYPKGKLHLVWCTDGSDDGTNDKLKAYPDVNVYFKPERRGKTAALTRGMAFVKTPIVIFTDANTMVNEDAVIEIARCFVDPKVGCVAGEKRVASEEKDVAAASGEGLYWKYESFLKKMDSRLNTAVGAAGELFAVRTELFEAMESDTLLDDFILSLRIAAKGYKIDYCDKSYAVEDGSANMIEEQKRKVRIAAGGLQSIMRLKALLNPFRYGLLSFQYVSHRVLRWSITPILFFLLLPINIVIVIMGGELFYQIFFGLQFIAYIFAYMGYLMSMRKMKNKLFFTAYYFVFMNYNVIRGFNYLAKKQGSGIWEKTRRAQK